MTREEKTIFIARLQFWLYQSVFGLVTASLIACGFFFALHIITGL